MTYLIAPRELGDGRVVWEDYYDVSARLRDGDPTCGWEGDERLSLVLNVLADRWEVWRRHEDGTSSLVCHRAGTSKPGPELIRRLAEHDTRKVDVLARVEAENAERERDRERESHAQHEEMADRLYYGLTKDLSAHMPAADGRVL